LGYVGSELPVVEIMMSAIFWDVAMHSLEVHQYFGGIYHLHLQVYNEDSMWLCVPSVFQFAYSLNVKMEGKCSFEILMSFK
jgi:hypothetical protein